MSWGGEEKKKPFNSRNSAVWTPELQHTRIPAASEHIKYKQSPFGLTHSHQPLKTDFFNQNPCFIPWEINLNVAKCAITHSKRKWEMTKFLGSILGQDPHFVMSFYFKQWQLQLTNNYHFLFLIVWLVSDLQETTEDILKTPKVITVKHFTLCFKISL